MQSKGLLSLTVVTGLAIVAAALTLREDDTRAENATEGHLFEGLLDRVNDVQRVTLHDGEGAITLASTPSGWTLVERGGYPVAFDKVKEAVMKMARLQIDEPKTARAANHAKLGVEDPGAEGATSKRVQLLDANGGELASVIVGNARSGSAGVFVRKDGEDQVYLCKGALSVDTTPTSWIEREILRLDAERVQEVVIWHPDSPEVRVARDPENTEQWRLLNPPEGREEDFPGVANSVGSALTYLSLDDVLPAVDVGMGDTPLGSATYRCSDGLLVEVRVSDVDGTRWATLNARFDEPPSVGPVPEEGAETEDAAGSESVRAEALELNRRLGPWAFAIPEYKADVLVREMEDLLKDLEAEAPAIPAADELPAMTLEDLMPPGDPDEEPGAESDDPADDTTGDGSDDESGDGPGSSDDGGLRRL